MPDPKPYANLARLTSLELARLSNDAEQGRAEEPSHVRFIACVLRACADVLDAQGARPSTRKCNSIVPRESGEHTIVDLVESTSGSWRAVG